MSTRTVEDEKKYQDTKKKLQSKLGFCPFHDGEKKIIQDSDLLIMFENDYPYAWADEHYLLFTKRHTNKPNEEETIQFNKLIVDLDGMGYVCLKNPDVLTSVWCYHYQIIKPYTPK